MDGGGKDKQVQDNLRHCKTLPAAFIEICDTITLPTYNRLYKTFDDNLVQPC